MDSWIDLIPIPLRSVKTWDSNELDGLFLLSEGINYVAIDEDSLEILQNFFAYDYPDLNVASITKLDNVKLFLRES